MVPGLQGLKLVILNSYVPTFSLPRLSSNSELQAAATCSWATAYALRCAVRLCHTAQQDGEFSVFSLYGILYAQDVYCIIIPLSTEAPHIRGILPTPENANTLTVKRLSFLRAMPRFSHPYRITSLLVTAGRLPSKYRTKEEINTGSYHSWRWLSFGDKASPCSPDCSQTHHHPAPASQVLALPMLPPCLDYRQSLVVTGLLVNRC